VSISITEQGFCRPMRAVARTRTAMGDCGGCKPSMVVP
jgi:hypothetical protein